MTKFNSKTLASLNRFSNTIANELITGLKLGYIHEKDGINNNVKSKVKKFLSMNKVFLAQKFGINVSNVLKTPKQLKFVLGSIEWRMVKANVA